eukprot:CAMPEP_0194488260 /NCGR_PEP_ID=MMETSP0253-20130528/8248_1 /TAXON_ID=2966 /ORGANISM="Noctiluca scintillans" /LENGTH=63 /DNA_ID=CAMNT_0039328597 /DNA_START=57 /DNA_END=248 /DNA_ORIENTATION=-
MPVTCDLAAPISMLLGLGLGTVIGVYQAGRVKPVFDISFSSIHSCWNKYVLHPLDRALPQSED